MSQEDLLKIIQDNPGILMSDIPKRFEEYAMTYSEQVRALERKKVIKRVFAKRTYELWSNV